jgi:hypothetical protein
VTPSPVQEARTIPDIAAISGIYPPESPVLNGNNSTNEHFSASFRQCDNGPRRPLTAAHCDASLQPTLENDSRR